MPVDDHLVQRVKEELAAEGEDEYSIWNRAYDALIAIIDKIAKRLRRTRDEIFEALKRLGGG